MTTPEAIRVLVVDDESAVREAYRELLLGATPKAANAPNEVEQLRQRLFQKEAGDAAEDDSTRFEVETADDAESGVAAVKRAIEDERPFDAVFLDMRMPPGPDGVWAAAQIRALAPDLDIVIATAYSDTDPREISRCVPPAEKLFYLQKPFHAHEVRQLAIALGHKARAQARMHQLAYYDSLTGLANRVLIREHLEARLAAPTRDRATVLSIDLDNFKRINDTLGHTTGDLALCQVAERIAGAAGAATNSEVARMGGDEFVVVLPDSATADEARTLAARIEECLVEAIEIGEHRLYMTPAIGICSAPEEADSVETLLRNANLAMHFAKQTGAERTMRYEPAMNASHLRRLSIDMQLRGAIERGELSLHYQPQLELSTGRVSAMEALLRWHNEELGDVPPLEFIELAEESGLIHEIGHWVLRTACNQAAAWIGAGLPLERIAVNVSAVQLTRPGFIEEVVAVLEESGLAPTALELEITETALIADLDIAAAKLEQLKALDIQLAIDDFGTGYSNVNQLKHLVVDRVKIDRSFVTNVDTSDRDRAIASAIISMAQSMNLRVTAEGVEHEGHIDVLELEHCDEIQGYLISRPMPAEQAAEYLHLKRD